MGNLRNWATPLTVGSFIISAVTGILIFFHLNIGLVKPAHEWLSWFMVLGVGLHLMVNWRAFKNYFSRPIPLIIMGIFVVLTVVSMLPFLANGEGRPPQVKVMQSLQQASITMLAEVQSKPLETVISDLKQAGIAVENPNQSVTELAEQLNISPQKVLGAAFK